MRRLIISCFIELLIIVNVSFPFLVDAKEEIAFINEFHYDNEGNDFNESVEVVVSSSDSSSDYTIVLYNGGNDCQPYGSTISLSEDFTVGESFKTNSGVVKFFSYIFPPNGLQNGSPDGIALSKKVDDTTTLIEFLSYEGTCTGNGGVADGVTSTDVGVAESGSTPIGYSLQRKGCIIGFDDISSSSWSAEPNTIGSINLGEFFCNNNNEPTSMRPSHNPTFLKPSHNPTPIPTYTRSNNPTFLKPSHNPTPIPTYSFSNNPTTLPPSSGAGVFIEKDILTKNQEVFIVTFDAGTSDIYVRLNSPIDIDIVLYDDSNKKVIHRNGGIINSENFERIEYHNNNNYIEYSGHNGELRADALGQEYLFVSGTIPNALTLKLYSHEAPSKAFIFYLTDYYSSAKAAVLASSASSLSETLKNDLHDIIDDHKEISYSACWEALQRTDQDPLDTNNVKLLYSRKSISKSDRDNGGRDPDLWNREHVWAKSHGNFGTSMGPGTDIHALRPADKSVNGQRSAKDFDVGGAPINLEEPRKDCPLCRETANSFEPPDEVKGDVARMIFYMDTRYNGDDGDELSVSNSVGTLKGSGTTGRGKLGKLDTLLAWNVQDPVSDEERRRNNIIHDIQGNRNPFIDHPEWVGIIFGGNAPRMDGRLKLTDNTSPAAASFTSPFLPFLLLFTITTLL